MPAFVRLKLTGAVLCNTLLYLEFLMPGHSDGTPAITNPCWHVQHRLLRIYAALHLAALYLAAAGALPGLSPWLQPQRIQPLLQALGLWEPSIVASMLPVLALLVLVSLCSCAHLYMSAGQVLHGRWVNAL